MKYILLIVIINIFLSPIFTDFSEFNLLIDIFISGCAIFSLISKKINKYLLYFLLAFIFSGIISLTIKNSETDNSGALILEFTEKPLSLKKWIIQDNLGENTTVLIQNVKYNNKISNLLFFQEDFPETYTQN